MSTNPWVTSPKRSAGRSESDESAHAEVPSASPSSVLPSLASQAASVEAPRVALPRRLMDVADVARTLCWVGTHGGAGETTLEQLLEGSRAMGHAWPDTEDRGAELPHVILIARTNARGLRAAQLAATEWAAGSVPVQLHGLILIADTPGRLPKSLKDFAQVVGGGVPRAWRLPWVEDWRQGEPVSAETAPKAIITVLDELRSTFSPASRSIPTS